LKERSQFGREGKQSKKKKKQKLDHVLFQGCQIKQKGLSTSQGKRTSARMGALGGEQGNKRRKRVKGGSIIGKKRGQKGVGVWGGGGPLPTRKGANASALLKGLAEKLHASNYSRNIRMEKKRGRQGKRSVK